MEKREGDRKEQKERKAAEYLRYSHLGLQFLIGFGLPTAVGIWLDRRWGTVVLFTILGIALGFTAALYSIYGELYGRGGKRKDKRDDRR